MFTKRAVQCELRGNRKIAEGRKQKESDEILDEKKMGKQDRRDA